MSGMVQLHYFMRQSRAWVFISAVIFYVITTVLSNQWFATVLPWVSLVTLVFALPVASKIGKLLTSLFLLSGCLLLFSQHESPMTFVTSFGSMFNLLSLFTAVPLLAVPLQVGDYRQTVAHLLTRRTLTTRGLGWIVSSISYFLSILMNIGAVPMMYSIVSPLGEQALGDRSNRFLIPSIVSGYTMPLLWSPVAAVLAAVVTETQVSWLTIFPVTFGLSVAGLWLSNLWWRSVPSPQACALDKLSGTNVTAPPKQTAHTYRRGSRLWEIAVGIAIFVICMFTIQAVVHWPIGVVIALLAFPFSFLWSTLIQRLGGFSDAFTKYRTAVAHLSTTFSVFTGAGFFVSALARSGYTHVLDEHLLTLSHTVTPVVFLAFVPFVIVLLALCGLHPVVSIALLSGVFHPSLLHLEPLWLAVALLAGGVVTFILSPFMATLTVAGTVSGEHPTVIMRWTAGYALTFLVLGDLVACLGQALLH